MKMNPEQFGALALQLLQSASIPGNALDAAMQFRATAMALAEGQAIIADAEPDATEEPPADGPN